MHPGLDERLLNQIVCTVGVAAERTKPGIVTLQASSTLNLRVHETGDRPRTFLGLGLSTGASVISRDDATALGDRPSR
jgi:hypothetical protein